jgi:DNA-binding SARP family transcriptional activator
MGDSTDLDFWVLGPLEVRRRGVRVPITAAKPRMALAALLLGRGQTLSDDALIDALWGPRPPASAGKTLQVYIWQLRDLLDPDRDSRGSDLLVRDPGGYRLAVEAAVIDLHRFETAWEQARTMAGAGDPRQAATLLRGALATWRGEPLGDLMYERFFEADVARMIEMRLSAHEDLIDAELASGGGGALVPELKRLSRLHPLRERLTAQLMVALYRSGGQTAALDVYEVTKQRLSENLGIDPSPALQAVWRQVLRQDGALLAQAASEPAGSSVFSRRGSLLAVHAGSRGVGPLALAAAGLIGRDPHRDLIVACTVSDVAEDPDLRGALEEMRSVCSFLGDDGVAPRFAAFTSPDAGRDVQRLVQHHGVDLVLADGRRALRGEDAREGLVDALLSSVHTDVALVVAEPSAGDEPSATPVVVPFGATDHDWAALELGAWIASTHGVPLQILGRRQLPGFQDGDASRLLAEASLLLQRIAGLQPEPVLIAPGPDGVLEAAAGARMLVVGLRSDWRENGLGDVRLTIAKRCPCPALFVRRGILPGVLASPRALTRLAWSRLPTEV